MKEIGDYYLFLVQVNFNFMITKLVNNLGYIYVFKLTRD